MRLLLFSFLISTSLYAQIDTGDGSLGACTRATFSGGGTYNCASLDISAGAAVTFGNGAAPVIIKVQGNVTINAAISVAGVAGNPDLNINGANQNGGLNGPGATPGGGVLAGSFAPQNGSDHITATDSNGKAGSNGACGGGGGGGAFAIAGDPGSDCTIIGPSGAGGNIFYSDIPSPLLGGLGGGSGGDGFPGFYGAGGGGGGAILIMAGGNIIINGNISARGGKGGDAIARASGEGGGGGGGGSGGVVAIKSAGQITNNGTIDSDGGTGGIAGDGGNGGDGGHGFVILEDVDGIIDGIGTIPPYGETGTSISQRQKSSKVTSDISCGVIKPKQDSNSALMQIILGFMIACGFGLLSKKSLKLFA